MVKEKVVIEIEPNRFYDKSHKNGAMYTSVSFSARLYGSYGGCDSDEEINKSIERNKQWIIEEGDIPQVLDMRKQAIIPVAVGQQTLF